MGIRQSKRTTTQIARRYEIEAMLCLPYQHACGIAVCMYQVGILYEVFSTRGTNYTLLVYGARVGFARGTAFALGSRLPLACGGTVSVRFSQR